MGTDPGTGYSLDINSLDLSLRLLFPVLSERLQPGIMNEIKPWTNIVIILSIISSMRFSRGIPKYGLYAPRTK